MQLVRRVDEIELKLNYEYGWRGAERENVLMKTRVAM